MKKSVSRILIEVIVKKTLRELKDSPERSTRNLIDLALHFSKAPFQEHFFAAAQTMLKNENSPYYALIRNVAGHVDSERLFTFAMNLGYNSCTMGAGRIRDNEKKLGYQIPWAIIWHLDGEQLGERIAQYSSAIEEGESLGIYSWMFFVRNQPQECFPFFKEHPDSAFFLFCDPSDVTEDFIGCASELHNLMLVVRYEENTENVFARLREEKLLYSAYYPYSQRDLDAIAAGELLMDIQQLCPLFTVLVARQGCPKSVRQNVYQAVDRMRRGQEYQTLPWELYEDNRGIDRIISDGSCPLFFDESGNPCEWDEMLKSKVGNLFTDGLAAVLEKFNPAWKMAQKEIVGMP